MLSRVAERIYWIARYIERAENSARLVSAYTHQMLDLPNGVEPGWRQLVDIIGGAPAFDEHYRDYDEHNTVSFLVADDFSTSSILTSVSRARENMRTTRELLPTEAWHYCNELYLQVRQRAHEGITRRGLLAGTMSHDTAYDLMRLGRNLERADMTTRIVDSAIFFLMPRQSHPDRYDNLLWINVLKSSSGDQMYRQHVRSRVEGAAVVRFLLQDRYFPRSVARAVSEAEFSLRHLPRNTESLRRTLELQEQVHTAAVDGMNPEEMHGFIDQLQLALNLVHNEIFRTWFQVHHPTPGISPTAAANA
jgi:uncharacterized alpha-E superfamily protein